MIGLMLFSAQTLAALGRKVGDEITMDINITGTVTVKGSCTFNYGESQDIDFGTITYDAATGRLDGEYIVPFDGGMTCSGKIGNDTSIKFHPVDGGPVRFQGHNMIRLYLNKAESDSLAIEVLADGEIVDADKDFPIDIKRIPRLEAKLIQTRDGPQSWHSGDEISAYIALIMTFE